MNMRVSILLAALPSRDALVFIYKTQRTLNLSGKNA